MLKNLAFVAGIFVFSAALHAQTRPASSPASATTAEKPRQAVVVPPGFKTISVADHSLLVESADEAWVRKAVADMKPTTMPTTMPTDLLSRISSHKDQVVKRIVTDLAIDDRAEVERFFNDSATKAVQNVEQIRPAVFYIVTTEKRLTELMRNGWTNDRFYYNRAADTVQQNANIDIYTKDDLLIPSVYSPDDKPEEKAEKLAKSIHMFEEQALNEFSWRGMSELRRELQAYLVTHVIKTESVKQDQIWFPLGVSANLTTRYMADLTGMSENFWLGVSDMEFRQNPLRSMQINLLSPTAIEELRPGSEDAYRGAYAFRSMQLMYSWMKNAGDANITKTIVDLRKTPAADGPSMIKQIQASSGIDLTAPAPQPTSAPATPAAK